jgi:hypothetical protein
MTVKAALCAPPYPSPACHNAKSVHGKNCWSLSLAASAIGAFNPSQKNMKKTRKNKEYNIIVMVKKQITYFLYVY